MLTQMRIFDTSFKVTSNCLKFNYFLSQLFRLIVLLDLSAKSYLLFILHRLNLILDKVYFWSEFLILMFKVKQKVVNFTRFWTKLE